MDLGVTLYVKNSAEAVDFYMDAFGMTLGYNAQNSDGSFLHAELQKEGRTIFAVSENGEESMGKLMLAARQPITSCGVNLDNDEELRHAYDLLCAGGHVLRELGPLPWSPCSADVVDQYGVCWYLFVSQHRPD
jgi:uncharacterized glyoxalase superfamily protein PhnB